MPPKKKITNATNLLKGCVPVAHIPFLVSGGLFDVNTLQPARSADQKPQAYIEKIFKYACQDKKIYYNLLVRKILTPDASRESKSTRR
jgi:hypothetical protein